MASDMPDFPVRPEKQAALVERMQRLGIREEDISEQFIRSRGRGGQKVNKTSSCVVLTHRPTGITVRCERERSQALNRYVARVRLVDKIEELVLGEASRQRMEALKVRRQKRRRSRRAKMLEEKHARSKRIAEREVPEE